MRLETQGLRFDITKHEARHIGVLKELDFENCDVPLRLDGLTSAVSLAQIVEFAKHHAEDGSTPKACSKRKMFTEQVTDYMSRWDAEWVSKLDQGALRDLLKACHALHYDVLKYVCLHHILLNFH